MSSALTKTPRYKAREQAPHLPGLRSIRCIYQRSPLAISEPSCVVLRSVAKQHVACMFRKGGHRPRGARAPVQEGIGKYRGQAPGRFPSDSTKTPHVATVFFWFNPPPGSCGSPSGFSGAWGRLGCVGLDDDDELNISPPTPCQIGKRPPAPKPKRESAGHQGVAGGGYWVCGSFFGWLKHRIKCIIIET